MENLNPNLPKDFPVGFKLNVYPVTVTNVVSNANKIEEPKPELVKTTDHNEKYPNNIKEEKVNAAITKATAFLGVKYKSGGTTSAGFDCSGLMLTAFESINVKLPRTSAEQAEFGTGITKENAQKGDLIFFKTGGSSNVNHVGLITEVTADGIKFIHASSSSGVIISSLTEDYYAKCFEKIGRVLE